MGATMATARRAATLARVSTGIQMSVAVVVSVTTEGYRHLEICVQWGAKMD